MRVLLTVIDANLVGGQRVALAIAKRLRQQGDEVLAAFPGQGPLQAAFGQAGIACTSLPSWRMRYPHAYLALYRTASSFRPDLIYAHCSTGGEFISTAVGKALGVPVVIHRHSRPYLGVGPVHQTGVKLLSRWMFRACAKVIAVSRATRGQVIELGGVPENVLAIHNGISPEALAAPPESRARIRAELGLPDGACVVLLMARLCEEKGQRLLLEAAKTLPVRELGLHFLLVGKDQEKHGVYEEHLKRLAADYELADRVVFAGHREDIGAIYAASDLFVLPSTADACPISILEAMSTKKPVIATATTGACELLEDGKSGLIVPIGQVGPLAEAVQRLAEHPDLREQLSVNAYERACSIFGEEHFLRSVLSVLHGVVR